MALDWGKEITFSGLRKSATKRKDEFPSKTYMNLAVSDRKSLDVRKTIPLAVLIVVLVVLFIKFGVFDFVGQVSAKQVELSQQREQLAQIESKLEGYDDVLAEYQSYASANLVTDMSSVSTLEVLDLVDRRITPAATVVSLSYSSNVVLLDLADISLEGAGNLVSSLYEEPSVANVTVSSATTGSTNGGSLVTMTITLQKVGDAQ